MNTERESMTPSSASDGVQHEKDAVTAIPEDSQDGANIVTHPPLPQPDDSMPPDVENPFLIPGPPALPFSPYDHKLSIFIFWFCIAAEACLIPVSFFYGLYFGTNINHGALFAIITSVFGFVSGYEYTMRGFQLLRKSDKYRPLNNSPRFWGFDFTHYALLGPYIVMTGVLIGGSIPTQPLIRVLALPMAIAMELLGFLFVLSYYATKRRWKLPYRMSSHVAGSTAPPVTYAIIEDVVAADCGAGKEYRLALKARYDASWRFRHHLLHLTLFWGLPSIIIGIAVLIIIWTVDKTVAYGIGWGVPAVWAIIWAIITIIWTRRALFIEKKEWVRDHQATMKDRAFSQTAAGWRKKVEEAEEREAETRTDAPQDTNWRSMKSILSRREWKFYKHKRQQAEHEKEQNRLGTNGLVEYEARMSMAVEREREARISMAHTRSRDRPSVAHTRSGGRPSMTLERGRATSTEQVPVAKRAVTG